MDYKQYLTDDLGWAVDQIPDQFPEVENWTDVSLAAACHLYVKMTVDYEVRGHNPRRRFRPPDELLEVYSGNCQEQTMLLASLLNSVPDIEVRTVSIRSNRDKFHMTPEIKFFTERSGYMGLHSFYEQTDRVEDVSGFSMDSFEAEDEKAYFPADPSHGDAVGDISWMEEHGYINRKDKQDWEWVRDPTYRKMKAFSDNWA